MANRKTEVTYERVSEIIVPCSDAAEDYLRLAHFDEGNECTVYMQYTFGVSAGTLPHIIMSKENAKVLIEALSKWVEAA